MFILNFGIVFTLSIIYGYLVKHRVEKWDPTRRTTSNNGGDQNQELLPNSGHNSYSTFSIYVIHLFVARIIPLLTFALCLFYPAQFPNNFLCPWRPEMQGKSTHTFNDTVNSQHNLTIIDCTNPNGGNSKILVNIIATGDVCFVILTCLELGYIAWMSLNDRNFMTDPEFCKVHLLGKQKTIRKLVDTFRERFNDNEVFQLTDDFGGPEISTRPLRDIYVNVIIQEGRERTNAYPEKFKRHEIYQSHLQTPSKVTKLTSPADIFKPKKGEQNQTYPRTILVIGRPGIGKTMLTRKLLHQWKVKDDVFWRDKLVILLQFRSFKNEPVTLREMLGCAKGLSDGYFETVYDFICSNPANTVLIFDGLDELKVESEYTNTETVGGGPDDKKPVFSMFQMLIRGRLLQGVTILTTSRPTTQHLFRQLNFDRTVEVLGFFEEQIKQYVFKFCDNESTSKLIWNQIQGSAEMRSLCYIPVNSYIVCLTLKESIENDESGSQLHESLNRNILGTITELYKRAVKVLLYRHHPKYRSQTRPSDYLIIPFPKELEKDLMELKKVAKKGICDDQLIFERTSRDEFGDLANCGLFTKLPDKQRNLFCFLHLTLQEFLAAAKVVDDMDKVVQFLDDHVKDPKWHLVIQFVAGLVGDKIREDPKESESSKVLVDIQKRYYIFRIVYCVLLQI
jgi:GTPase SAR1 family protein